jgi:O-antigen ligase
VPLLAVVVASVVAIAAAFALHLDIVAKQERYEAANAKFSLRDGIWRTGLLAWQHYPWFGVGLGNYSEVSEKRVQGWLAAEGRTAPPGHYVIWVHGHSLFVNSLTERGVIGVAPLLAVLVAWGVGLLRRRPAAGDSDLAWMVWGASASALGITVLAGLLNTTLHHEHGILAVLLLGLWLGRAKANPAS